MAALSAGCFQTSAEAGICSVAGGLQGKPKEISGDVLRLFVSVFDISSEELAPLGKAMESGDIDFMRLPLDEFPALSLPYSEEELASILFLISRPYFSALREACPLVGSQC